MTVATLVDQERARLRRLHLAAGLALAIAATLALVALGAWVLGRSRWIALPRVAPFAVWAIVVIADAVVLWWTWRRLARTTARAAVASAIEREQSLRTGALRGVLEVEGSGALARRAADAMATRLAPAGARLAPRTRRGAARVVLQAGLAAGVAVLALGAVRPAFSDGLRAIISPVHAWRGTLLAPIAFRDLPSHVVRGESLTLDVDAPGRSAITVSARATGEGWRTVRVAVDRRSGRARVPLGAVAADVSIVATDGRASSDTAVVRATDRPFLGGVAMRAVYPAYLGRAPEALPVGEPARVPRGTRVEISGRASTELRDVRLTSGRDTVPLAARGRAFDGAIEALASGRWAWTAVGVGGPVRDVPLPIELDVVPDSAPRAEIIDPPTDTIIAPDESVSVHAAANDDRGLASVELRSWKVSAGGGAEAPVVARLTTSAGLAWDGQVPLDLTQRGLQPGDVLHVQATATDNSPWAQRGSSRELLLRVPTLEERRAIARAAADSAASNATATARAQQALEQRTEEAARDRGQRNQAQSGRNGETNESSAQSKSDQTMSYDAAEKARAVAKDQQALVDRVKNLQQSARQLEQQLKAAGALDTALARQLHDAQQLLRDALTQELLQQMQKLQDATKQLSGEQSRDAMRDLTAMQQKLREQLEKSAEMLRRAALEGAMQTLHDEAKEIAAREQQLADSSANGKTDAQRAEAKQLADRSQRFSDDVQQLQGRLEREKAREGADRTAEARRRADASEEALRNALGEKSGDRTKAGEKRQPSSANKGVDSAAVRQRGDSSAAGAQPPGDPQRGAGRSADAKPGDAKPGDAKPGDAKPGDAKPGDAKPGDAKTADAKGGEKQAGASAGAQQRSGQQGAERQGSQPSAGDKRQSGSPSAESGGDQQESSGAEQSPSGERSGMRQGAQSAAQQMQRAAQAMQEARDRQVQSWKQELTQELDRAIQETLAMAREESSLEQQARSGQSSSDDVRGRQSALQQGLDKTAQRLQQQSQKTSLLSGRAQRAVDDARQKVSQATQSVSDPQRTGSQPASALGEAADALNRAAASLARDREKANSASSASGFAEMLQQMQELAKKQGGINSQAAGLLPMPGGQPAPGMEATARALARAQRQVANQLDELGDDAGGDKAAELAREARQLADALDNGRIDASTVARQQQLFRRLLDAGRTLEKDERDDPNKREAKAAVGAEALLPTNTDASGRAALRYREPTWDELRGLTPDERRAIIDYFKRLNAQNP